MILRNITIALIIGTTGVAITSVQAEEQTEEVCDEAYPDTDVCIPPAPPDLDCSDITYRNFTVVEPDPHNFDGDEDGIGCETKPPSVRSGGWGSSVLAWASLPLPHSQ